MTRPAHQKSCGDCRARHLKCFHRRVALIKQRKRSTRKLFPRFQLPNCPVSHSQETGVEIEFNLQEAHLLSDFIRIIVPWFELFDAFGKFRETLPKLIKSSPMLSCACLAYAFKRRCSLADLAGRNIQDLSRNYYQEAATGLAEALETNMREKSTIMPVVLATALILCGSDMYEGYFHNWELHLSGISVLLDPNSLLSDSFETSMFWVFAREDTGRVWLHGGQTLLAPDCWPQPASTSSECYYANRTLKLLASVLNYRDLRTQDTIVPNGGTDVEIVCSSLTQELENLKNSCDASFLTVVAHSTVQEGELPVILQSSSRQSSTLQMLLSCRLLLLPTTPLRNAEYAQDILALIAGGLDESCLLHATQPLCLAGQQLLPGCGLSEVRLKTLRRFVLTRLCETETRTGWKTLMRREALVQLWNKTSVS